MTSLAAEGAQSTVPAVVPEKSANDSREYRHITLANKMQILLVSDPETDKAAAAMDVAVGHFSDPEELPGLAHFCEHMLFLGTEKYPDENSYSAFLNDHGGMSNAYTDMENTNYYFDVGHEHLAEALDRFSQFFSAPLFTASATDRELEAVDSENSKNLLNDSWRMFQLTKSTSSSDHPYHKFGSGNKATLKDRPAEKGIDTRENLLSFHKEYYSANNMRLAVVGKEPLDTLQAWVTQRFEGVRNTERPVPSFEGMPLRKEDMAKSFLVQPVKELRTIELSFQTPSLRSQYRAKPSQYLSHLVGHEGPGSILSLLKARGLANGLTAGQFRNTSGFGTFNVNIDATDEGIASVDKIVTVVFQYLKKLREAGPQRWIFDESNDIAKNSFRFKSKENPMSYATSLASDMHRYDPKDVLSAKWIASEFDPAAITALLDCLVPSNMRLYCAHGSFESVADVEEKWYGTRYKMEDIGDEKLRRWTDPEDEPLLTLPERNAFLASDFDLRCDAENAKSEGLGPEEPQVRDEKKAQGFGSEATVPPCMVQDGAIPGTRLWFKMDRTYRQPKLNAVINIRSPVAYDSPKGCVMTSMFAALVKDALNELAYDAELAGVSYSLDNERSGIRLILGGFNQKLAILAGKVGQMMGGLMDKLDPERFRLIKAQKVLEERNFTKEQPYQWAIYVATYTLRQPFWFWGEKLQALESLSLEDLKLFVPRLLSSVHIDALVHGNAGRSEANAITQSLLNALQSQKLPVACIPTFRSISIPDGTMHIHRLPAPDPENDNSAVEFILQLGPRTDEIGGMTELLAHCIKEPCFDQLRTKETLGYLVFSGTRLDDGVMSIRILLQSQKHGPAYLHSRVENFLTLFKEKLCAMTDEQFADNVKAVIAELTEKKKKLWDETREFMVEIGAAAASPNFGRSHREAATIAAVAKDALIQFFDQHVAQNAPRRRLFVSHVVGKGKMETEEEISAMKDIKAHVFGSDQESLDNLKRGMALYPAESAILSS